MTSKMVASSRMIGARQSSQITVAKPLDVVSVRSGVFLVVQATATMQQVAMERKIALFMVVVSFMNEVLVRFDMRDTGKK
jgi:hypothetical protein